MLVLSIPPLSKGVTAARLAFLGKVDVRMLMFIAWVTGRIRKSFDSFTNFGGILSSPVDFFGFISCKRFLVLLSWISWN